MVFDSLRGLAGMLACMAFDGFLSFMDGAGVRAREAWTWMDIDRT